MGSARKNGINESPLENEGAKPDYLFVIKGLLINAGIRQAVIRPLILDAL